MIARVSLLLTASCLVMGAAGCAEDSRTQPKTPELTAATNDDNRPPGIHPNPNETAAGADATDPAMRRSPADTAQANGSAGSGAAPSGGNSAGAALTDEQILAVVTTANSGEIEQAKLAQTKAKDARVKRFADMMITDHTAANVKASTVAKNHKLAPADSNLKIQLTGDSGTIMSSLRSPTGADFDHAYLDAQVREHRQVLDLIDSRLLADVKDSDLKGLIAEMRPKVEAHWKEAQKLQGQVDSGGGTTNSP